MPPCVIADRLVGVLELDVLPPPRWSPRWGRADAAGNAICLQMLVFGGEASSRRETPRRVVHALLLEGKTAARRWNGRHRPALDDRLDGDVADGLSFSRRFVEPDGRGRTTTSGAGCRYSGAWPRSCWVGLVFSSPAAARKGTSVTWMGGSPTSCENWRSRLERRGSSMSLCRRLWGSQDIQLLAAA